jgi:hypothetical protein
MSTIFKQVFDRILAEDMTSGAFGADSQYYDNMGMSNADHPQSNDARMPKILGAKKKINRRTAPETVFLTGKITKSAKSKKK